MEQAVLSRGLLQQQGLAAPFQLFLLHAEILQLGLQVVMRGFGVGECLLVSADRLFGCLPLAIERFDDLAFGVMDRDHIGVRLRVVNAVAVCALAFARIPQAGFQGTPGLAVLAAQALGFRARFGIDVGEAVLEGRVALHSSLIGGDICRVMTAIERIEQAFVLEGDRLLRAEQGFVALDQLPESLTQFGLMRKAVGLFWKVPPQPVRLLSIERGDLSFVLFGLALRGLETDADRLGGLPMSAFLVLDAGCLLSPVSAVAGIGLLQLLEQTLDTGMDATQLRLTCAQLGFALEDVRHRRALLHGLRIGGVMRWPIGNLAPFSAQRDLGVGLRDTRDDHALEIVKIGAAQEHAADDLLDVGQMMAAADEGIVGHQRSLLLPGPSTAEVALDDGAVVADARDHVAMTHALHLQVPLQLRHLDDIDAVRSQEQLGPVRRAHEAIAPLTALLAGMQYHHAGDVTATVLEDNVGGDAWQVVAVEIQPVGFGTHDPRWLLALEDRYQLQQRGLAAPVSAGQDSATLQRELDNPPGAIGVDQDQL